MYRHTANGKESYDKVCEAIHLLEKYSVDYNILTVVHRQSINSVEEILVDLFECWYGEWKQTGKLEYIRQ